MMRITSSAASGLAQAQRFDGQRLILASDISAPPGSPLTFAGDDSPGAIALKTVRCRRAEPEAELAFEIDARVVNLSRVQREWLERLVAAQTKEGYADPNSSSG